MRVYLRAACMDDAETVLEWRNDPLTRSCSFSKNAIGLEAHMEWFRRKLSDETCDLFMLMNGSERIGQLRIDKIDNIGEISYMIAPDWRNRGYGKRILELAESAVKDDIRVLVGLVLHFNEASCKCFKVNNYTELGGGGI